MNLIKKVANFIAIVLVCIVTAPADRYIYIGGNQVHEYTTSNTLASQFVFILELIVLRWCITNLWDLYKQGKG